MPLSERDREAEKPRDDRRVDLRGWVALAWAGWFAARYAAMVLEARGDRIAALVAAIWPG